MDLVQLDDRGQVFISPHIDDWGPLATAGISAVIDLDGGLDLCIPMVPNHVIYLYFPFNDAELPDLSKLHAVGRFGAELVKAGHKVLTHCGLGFNRSALVAGLILRYSDSGHTCATIVEHLRQRRPGALYNEVYASHLCACTLQP